MARLILFNLLLFSACAYALLRGTRDARIIAVACLVAAFASYPLRGWYGSVELSVLIVDLLLFLVFTYVALGSDRYWPLWLAGLQLTGCLGHAMKAIEGNLLPMAYAVALRSWSYPILIILAVAVWRSDRRRQHERVPAG